MSLNLVPFPHARSQDHCQIVEVRPVVGFHRGASQHDPICIFMGFTASIEMKYIGILLSTKNQIQNKMEHRMDMELLRGRALKFVDHMQQG